MKRVFGAGAALMLALFAAVGCSGYADIGKMMSTREAIRASNIYVQNVVYTDMYGHRIEAGTSLGSGVIFEVDELYCYALTNWHVIDCEQFSGNTITVTDIDGTSARASVLVSDESRDIAIIRFLRGTGEVHCIDYQARLRRSLGTKELLFAVGNPGEVRNNVTFGQYLGMAYIRNVEFAVIHHSALIYEGNSGGALCDLDGNLVGLNTWGSENNDEDNYAIPLEIICEFIEEWRASAGQAA